MALDLDFDRLNAELRSDLGDVFDRVAGAARGGLDKIAGVAQNTGTGLEKIAGQGGGTNPLARIALLGAGGGASGLAQIAGYGGYGGGTGLEFFDTLGGTDPFAAFNRASATLAAQPVAPEPQTPAGYPGATGAGGGATSAAPLGSARWADKINQYAARYADAPDLAEVAQAMIELESGGDPNAQGVVVTSGPYAGQRAQGLGQIMPGNYPGVNLMDPDTNIQKMLEMLYERYKRYGNWDSAVASYFGAVDAQGRPTTAADDNGTTGIQYVAIVNGHRQTIRNARPVAAGGGAGLASLFNGNTFGTTQSFGRTDFSTGPGASIYDFGTEFGLDGDSHTGWDIGTPVGTQFYMPQGLSGTVEIAGGSGYYTSDGGDGPGKGELRINLDNGYQLILGHNSQINVQAGQRVTAGMLLGLTGSANGAHQHIEVRVRDNTTRSGWRIVDPAVLFGRPG